MNRIDRVNDDLSGIIELFNRMKQDTRDNGINMFNANDEFVDDNNMFSFFYKFIKKHIHIIKKGDDIINV